MTLVGKRKGLSTREGGAAKRTGHVAAIHYVHACKCHEEAPWFEFFVFFFKYIWSVLLTRMSVHYACAHGSQKKVSDPLELELQVTVSHHMGAGN